MRYKSLFRLKCLCLGLSVCVCVCSCVFCVCLSDCVRACVSELGQTSGNGNVCMRNTANDRARQGWGVEGVRESEIESARESERDVGYHTHREQKHAHTHPTHSTTHRRRVATGADASKTPWQS